MSVCWSEGLMQPRLALSYYVAGDKVELLIILPLALEKQCMHTSAALNSYFYFPNINIVAKYYEVFLLIFLKVFLLVLKQPGQIF